MSLHITYFPVAFSDACEKRELAYTDRPLYELLADAGIPITSIAVFINDARYDGVSSIPDDSYVTITTALYNTDNPVTDFFKDVGKTVSKVAHFMYMGAKTYLPQVFQWAGHVLHIDDLINRIRDSLIPDMPDGQKARRSATARPDIAGAQNQNSPSGRVPVILGRHRISPNIIGQYWTEATTGTRVDAHGNTVSDNGHDLYLHMLLCVGYAPLRLTRFRVGDFDLNTSMTAGLYDQAFTLTKGNAPFLTAEDDIRIQVKQTPGAMDPTLYGKRSIETSVGTEIVWPHNVTQAEYAKATVVRMTARGVWQVHAIVDSQAFIAYNNDGEQNAEAITFQLYWRKPGTDAWQTFADAGSQVTVPGGKYLEEMRFNLYGTYPEYDAARPTQIEVTVLRNRPNKIDAANPSFGSDSAWSYRDQWTWSTMHTVTQDEPVVTDIQDRLCRVAIRIKATDNMSGNLNAINMIATSILPSMNADTGVWMFTPGNDYSKDYPITACWDVWKETANNADLFVAAFLDKWSYTGSMRLPDGTEYTGPRKLAYAQDVNKFLSWERIQDLWRWCNEPVQVSTTNGNVSLAHQSAYNRVLYEGMRLDDLLNSILLPARASYLPEGNKRSIYHDAFYDQPRFADVAKYKDRYHQKQVSGIITPKNSTDFAVGRTFAQTPDQIKITFISEASDYYQSTTLTFRNPYITTEQYNERLQNGRLQTQSITLTGVTNAYMCKLYAAYVFSVAINRQVTASCTVGIMHYFYPIGSRVSVSHDTIMTGLAQGRIQSYTDASDLWCITLDEDVSYPADTAAFRIKVWPNSTGVLADIACVPYLPEAQEGGYMHTKSWLINKTALTFSYTALADSSYAIGIAGVVASDYLIISRAVDANNNAQLQLVQAADAVHDSDYNIFTPYDPPVGNLVVAASVSQLRPAQPAPAQAAAITTTLNAVATAIDVVKTGQAAGQAVMIPEVVPAVTARAAQNYIKVEWVWSGSELRNSAKRFAVEVSKDKGATWSDPMYSSMTAYTYVLNRDVDGYPEKVAFANWRFRVLCENIYGNTSPTFGPTNAGVTVNTNDYDTWVPRVPVLSLSTGGTRTVSLLWREPVLSYGQDGVELQVQKAYTVLPTGEIATRASPAPDAWFSPALGLDPYADIENYKTGVAGGMLWRQGNTCAFPVPLYGQQLSPCAPRNTPYFYRIRARGNVPTTANRDAHVYSAWSAANLVIATCTTAQDVVRARKITDTGKVVKVDGALDAASIYVEMLSAITANLGVITDGTLKGGMFNGGPNNMWALSRTTGDDGKTIYEGTVRMGGEDQYLRIIPRVADGVVTGYDIAFKVGSFDVSAIGSTVSGNFKVVPLGEDSSIATPELDVRPTEGCFSPVETKTVIAVQQYTATKAFSSNNVKRCMAMYSGVLYFPPTGGSIMEKYDTGTQESAIIDFGPSTPMTVISACMLGSDLYMLCDSYAIYKYNVVQGGSLRDIGYAIGASKIFFAGAILHIIRKGYTSELLYDTATGVMSEGYTVPDGSINNAWLLDASPVYDIRVPEALSLDYAGALQGDIANADVQRMDYVNGAFYTYSGPYLWKRQGGIAHLRESAWKKVTLPIVQTIRKVLGNNRGDVVIQGAGTAPSIVMSRDGGTTWISKTIPSVTYAYSFAIDDAGTLLFCDGSRICKTTLDLPLAGTPVLGAQSGCSMQPDSILMTATGKAFVLATSTTQAVALYSGDSGATWKTVNTGLGAITAITSVMLAKDYAIYVCGSFYVRVTSAAAVKITPSVAVVKMCQYNSSAVIGFTGNNDPLLLSTDGALTFSKSMALGSVSLNGVFATGDSCGIFHSNNASSYVVTGGRMLVRAGQGRENALSYDIVTDIVGICKTGKTTAMYIGKEGVLSSLLVTPDAVTPVATGGIASGYIGNPDNVCVYKNGFFMHQSTGKMVRYEIGATASGIQVQDIGNSEAATAVGVSDSILYMVQGLALRKYYFEDEAPTAITKEVVRVGAGFTRCIKNKLTGKTTYELFDGMRISAGSGGAYAAEAASVFISDCDTAQAVVVKKVTVEDLSMRIGTRLYVHFTNAACASARLSINDIVIPIKIRGSVTDNASWPAGACVTFVYDGTNVCVQDILAPGGADVLTSAMSDPTKLSLAGLVTAKESASFWVNSYNNTVGTFQLATIPIGCFKNFLFTAYLNGWADVGITVKLPAGGDYEYQAGGGQVGRATGGTTIYSAASSSGDKSVSGYIRRLA